MLPAADNPWVGAPALGAPMLSTAGRNNPTQDVAIEARRRSSQQRTIAAGHESPPDALKDEGVPRWLATSFKIAEDVARVELEVRRE